MNLPGTDFKHRKRQFEMGKKYWYFLLLFLLLLFLSSVITLMEDDMLSDDFIGKPQTFKLNGLDLDKVYQKTFVFREVFICVSLTVT